MTDSALFDVQAEAQYLGLLLQVPHWLAHVRGLVEPRDFTRSMHRHVYDAVLVCAALATADHGESGAYFAMVRRRMDDAGQRDDLDSFLRAGGLLVDASPDVLPTLARRLRQATARRDLLQIGQLLAQTAYAPQAPTAALLAVQHRLTQINQRLADEPRRRGGVDVPA